MNSDMLWKKDNSEKKINQINESLKKSFANVKRDTTNIFQWLNIFYKKSMEQEQMLKQIQLEFSYMPKTKEEIKMIIDQYYSFESITGKITELNGRVDELIRKQFDRDRHLQQIPNESIEKRLERLEHKKLTIKEKIIKKLTRNSKEYVKSVISSYIKKYGKISALQLKEIVVDEQNFCSKSSFYRLLEEIEELDEVGFVKKGKEKHYIAKNSQKISIKD